ncbi:hypothetical protein GIB67_039245 [Kingdonia uniflora]|uniref:Uncharacterized protein n=1 Tax=Kingdonia uniflora TaxID=39325 RepID=A0A7J7MM79_9MAGN|nr:hypothetical protein GIB67_039245 [Kingdonia uniflora]
MADEVIVSKKPGINKDNLLCMPKAVFTVYLPWILLSSVLQGKLTLKFRVKSFDYRIVNHDIVFVALNFSCEKMLRWLRQIQPDNKMKQKMVEILKRLHSQEEETDLVDEDEGNQICLDDLTAEELKQFQRAVVSRELSKLIEPWNSARKISLAHEGTQLIKLIYQQRSPEDAHLIEIPAGPEHPLSPISKLSLTQPSPFLPFYMVDIIYSYCFTLRLYNGDNQSDPLGVAMVVLSLSSVLGKAKQPVTVSEALAHPLEQTCSTAYSHRGGLKFGLGLLEDIISLFNLGGPVLVCSLCDLKRFIAVGERELKLDKLSKLKRADMKTAILEVEKKSIAAVNHGGIKKAVDTVGEGGSQSKVLIEEVR